MRASSRSVVLLVHGRPVAARARSMCSAAVHFGSAVPF